MYRLFVFWLPGGGVLGDGYVDIPVAALICFGFLIGGLFGARFSEHLSNLELERVFGVVMLLISLKMIMA
ncbi:MAG TPA: TSUP family transporter [Desulfobaccales bacterium]